MASVRSVQRNESLSDERRQDYFAEIYRPTVQDDVDALADLGFLSTPSPDWHSHLPGRSPDRAATMLRLLAVLRAADKSYFRPGRPGFEPVDLLRGLSLDLASSDPALARAIGERLARPAAAGAWPTRRRATGAARLSRAQSPEPKSHRSQRTTAFLLPQRRRECRLTRRSNLVKSDNNPSSTPAGDPTPRRHDGPLQATGPGLSRVAVPCPPVT